MSFNYAQRFLHLFTNCFMKISPQSLELIQLLCTSITISMVDESMMVRFYFFIGCLSCPSCLANAIQAPFLHCCPNCPNYLVRLHSIDRATWAIWTATKKYNLKENGKLKQVIKKQSFTYFCVLPTTVNCA